MKTPLSLRRVLAGLCGVIALLLVVSPSLPAQNTAPQQLLFTGLLGSSNLDPSNARYAQFNAIQSDSAGNLYLLLDQGDGIRLLKTDPTATNILAQAHLGSSGDIGLAMTLASLYDRVAVTPQARLRLIWQDEESPPAGAPE